MGDPSRSERYIVVSSDASVAQRDAPSILFLPGSKRSDSVNVALAKSAASVATAYGLSASVIDLNLYEMPIYDGDCEAEVGVPEAAVRLHGFLVAADIVVFVSPEYNGAPTPLLKNAIDWVTRVSKRPLESKTVGLMCATPGAGGGITGLSVLSLIMRSIRANESVDALPVGNARTRIAEQDPVLQAELYAFIDSLAATTPGSVPA